MPEIGDEVTVHKAPDGQNIITDQPRGGLELIEHTEHRPMCYAVHFVKKGIWITPWSGVWKESHMLSNDGKDYASEKRLFHFERCNDPECPALRRIPASVISELEILLTQTKQTL